MVDKTRKVNWLKVLLAFLIATFLFSFGLFLGYLAGKIIEDSNLMIEQEMKEEISNFETLAIVQKNYPCSNEILDTATDRLGYLSKFMEVMEKQKGKKNEEVLRMKKLYSILETRHMLLSKEAGEKCNISYNIVQFFYSNSQECEADLDKVSFILDYVRNKNPNMKTYSFDIDLQSDVVYILKQNYNATGCYNVILNDKKIDFDINEASSFEKLLKK